ncbi:radical SAM protein [Clostridium amazonitimonense]|uniref:radical SAM protein n=1 Tax=Clostridium amazonitimonense TaxID=1499689 RepID=UPI00068CD20E|nr:radical SAM protein [Clostridium amazonitimonense]
MKNITVNITSKCTAECRHCCFSCSPSRIDKLEVEEIWKVVNYGINSEEINEIAITGGEPFLYEDLVFEIIKAVSEKGKIVTCITNGFWGVTYEIALAKMKKLCEL